MSTEPVRTAELTRALDAPSGFPDVIVDAIARGLASLRQMISSVVTDARHAVASVMTTEAPPTPMPRQRNVISNWPDEGPGADGAKSLTNHGEWVSDLSSLPPLYDRGGGVAIYGGPSGPIGKLARIELNRLSKAESLDDGLGNEPFSKVEVVPEPAPSAEHGLG